MFIINYRLQPKTYKLYSSYTVGNTNNLIRTIDKIVGDDGVSVTYEPTFTLSEWSLWLDNIYLVAYNITDHSAALVINTNDVTGDLGTVNIAGIDFTSGYIIAV